jgi:hypothetical protein
MGHAIRLTTAVKAGGHGVESAWARRDLKAVIGAHRRARVGQGRPPVPSARSGDPWVRIGRPLGLGQLTDAVTGDHQGARAVFRPPSALSMWQSPLG